MGFGALSGNKRSRITSAEQRLSKERSPDMALSYWCLHNVFLYLWEVPDFVEIPIKTADEQRLLIIGKISEKHWAAIITYRHENNRIISGRRLRIEEVAIYES